MGKAAEISKTVRSNVILLMEEGYKNCDIAKRLKVSAASVSRIIRTYKENGSFSPKKRSGRPRKSTERMDREMRRLCVRKPSITSSEIKKSLPLLANMSTRTIRRRLYSEMNLPTRKALKKPLLTPRMAKQRLEFCFRYRHWKSDDWEKVMFSDESKFLQFSSYKPFVRRPPGSSATDPRYIEPTVKHPPSVMVWGSVSSKGCGGLYFLPKGVNE